MTAVPQRLYLAGPMSGVPAHNSPLFNRVAALLRARGHQVFNPAENPDGGRRQSRAFYMRLDIPALLGSEAVVVLPDWQRSRGATLEVWLALDLGMPIYRYTAEDGTDHLEPLRTLELRTLPVWGEPAYAAES
jgi:nucleoside 2-deoxyribosyltransferase